MPDRATTVALRSQDIVRAYARWAPIYDVVFDEVMRQGRRTAAEAVRPDARHVIELGVGTGLSLPYFRGDLSVTGIDISPHMLVAARRLVERCGLRNVTELREMNACALDYPDDSFDAALAMFAVTCAQDPERMLCEARRVVRPGGRVILLSRFASEAGPAAWLGDALAPVGHWLGFNTTVKVSSLAGLPGLELVSSQPVGALRYYRLLEFAVEPDILL